MNLKSMGFTVLAVVVGMLAYDMLVSKVLKVNTYERD